MLGPYERLSRLGEIVISAISLIAGRISDNSFILRWVGGIVDEITFFDDVRRRVPGGM